MKVPQGASRRKARYTCRLAEVFDAGLATAWKAKLSRTAGVVNQERPWPSATPAEPPASGPFGPAISVFPSAMTVEKIASNLQPTGRRAA
jgi:hypothetical protein